MFYIEEDDDDEKDILVSLTSFKILFFKNKFTFIVEFNGTILYDPIASLDINNIHKD